MCVCLSVNFGKFCGEKGTTHTNTRGMATPKTDCGCKGGKMWVEIVGIFSRCYSVNRVVMVGNTSIAIDA